MKALFATVLLLAGLAGYSQRGPAHGSMKDMSPEQVATLETKKMTLALDLTEKQQQEIQAIHMEKAIERQTRMEERKNRDEKPDADERFQMMNDRLDKQIAMKDQMRDILDKDQFEKWEKLNLTRGRSMNKGRCKGHKGRSHRG